jgi:hypothetical protein
VAIFLVARLYQNPQKMAPSAYAHFSHFMHRETAFEGLLQHRIACLQLQRPQRDRAAGCVNFC